MKQEAIPVENVGVALSWMCVMTRVPRRGYETHAMEDRVARCVRRRVEECEPVAVRHSEQQESRSIGPHYPYGEEEGKHELSDGVRHSGVERVDGGRVRVRVMDRVGGVEPFS